MTIIVKNECVRRTLLWLAAYVHCIIQLYQPTAKYYTITKQHCMFYDKIDTIV